jgi:hypothetical protein
MSNGQVQDVDATGKVVFQSTGAANGKGKKGYLPYGTGWIAATLWDAPCDLGFGGSCTQEYVNWDQTNWVVPPAPTDNDNQLIYLFNGIENAQYILQPVLQWGVSPAGGGAYWATTCWYVWSSGAWHGGLDTHSVGDSIHGWMSQSPSAELGLYSLSCGVGSGDALDVGFSSLLFEATETLEAYRISQCGDYPNTSLTQFSSIYLTTNKGTPSLSWSTQNNVTDCGQSASVVSNSNPGGVVDIYY